MACLATACSAVRPILALSAPLGLSITQPRDLKYCIMLCGMRRIKENEDIGTLTSWLK